MVIVLVDAIVDGLTEVKCDPRLRFPDCAWNVTNHLCPTCHSCSNDVVLESHSQHADCALVTQLAVRRSRYL